MAKKSINLPSDGKPVADNSQRPDPKLSEFEQQMFVARQIMENDREMLAKLAKL